MSESQSRISPALEARREILLRLTAITQINPKRWTTGENQSDCQFCGFRPKRDGNLCVDCEARRVRFAAEFPDVPPPIQDRKPPLSVRVKSASGMTALGAIQRPDWSPHNSE